MLPLTPAATPGLLQPLKRGHFSRTSIMLAAAKRSHNSRASAVSSREQNQAAQAVLEWVVTQPGVASAVITASSAGQLNADTAALGQGSSVPPRSVYRIFIPDYQNQSFDQCGGVLDEAGIGEAGQRPATLYERRVTGHAVHHPQGWDTEFYEDWGSGRPAVFSHGWPRMGFGRSLTTGEGHVRSTRMWGRNTMDE
jgi:hypothetical protein